MNHEDFAALQREYDRAGSQREWLAAKVWAGFLLAIIAAALIILACSASEAHAGLLDFLGDIGSSVAEATWKVVLIKAVQSSLTTIIFLVCIVGVIACAYGAAMVANKFTDLARAAFRDDDVTAEEKVVLVSVGVVDLGVVIILFWMAYFLIGAAMEIRT